eukprot:3815052-Rhodomonas_salina.1
MHCVSTGLSIASAEADTRLSENPAIAFSRLFNLAASTEWSHTIAPPQAVSNGKPTHEAGQPRDAAPDLRANG